MKHVTFLTFAASIAFSAFIISLCFGLISMPVFMVSAMTWISLLTVHSYSAPKQSWLPKTAKARMMAAVCCEKVSLPLAA